MKHVHLFFLSRSSHFNFIFFTSFHLFTNTLCSYLFGSAFVCLHLIVFNLFFLISKIQIFVQADIYWTSPPSSPEFGDSS